MPDEHNLLPPDDCAELIPDRFNHLSDFDQTASGNRITMANRKGGVKIGWKFRMHTSQESPAKSYWPLHHYIFKEEVMTFSRWFICASFAGGLLAFSLQPAGIATAGSSTFTDGSSGGNQLGQQGSGSGNAGSKGTTSAESSMKMQSEKDSPSSGSSDKNTMGQSGPKQGDTKSGVTGQEDSSTGRGNQPSPSSGSNNMNSGSGTSGPAR